MYWVSWKGCRLEGARTGENRPVLYRLFGSRQARRPWELSRSLCRATEYDTGHGRARAITYRTTSHGRRVGGSGSIRVTTRFSDLVGFQSGRVKGSTVPAAQRIRSFPV